MTDSVSIIDSLLGEAPVPAKRATPGPTLEFTIRKVFLALLLEKADTVISTREVMPVLTNFRFEVTDNRLQIVASDLELCMIATTEMITVAKPGVTVLPAKRLSEIVREADDGDVHIKVVNGVAYITIARTSWSLKLQSGHDYPPLPKITETVFAAVDRAKFLAAILAVRYAACKDSGSRGSLMMIDVRNGVLTACDGSRFQQATLTDPPSFDFRLPIGAVDDLVRLLKMSDLDTVHIGESENHLIFKFGSDVFIVSKLVAQFPDLQEMWLRPAMENRHKLTVDKKALLLAIKRVRINADTETSAIGLALTHTDDGGQITVTAMDKYGNSSSESIEAGWQGPRRVVVVNHRYLSELLTGHPGTSCTFRLGEDTRTRKSPILLRDDTSSTAGVLHQMFADWIGAE